MNDTHNVDKYLRRAKLPGWMHRIRLSYSDLQEMSGSTSTVVATWVTRVSFPWCKSNTGVRLGVWPRDEFGTISDPYSSLSEVSPVNVLLLMQVIWFVRSILQVKLVP